MKKIMFGLLAAMAISNAQAEGNFLNLASKPAKIDGVLEASLDKPYPKFVQDWMKDSKLAGLGRIIQGKIFESTGTIERKFYARSESEHEKTVEDAVGTFKAYCEHHQGTVETLTSDIFCVNGREVQWMGWWYKDNYTNFAFSEGYTGEQTYRSKVTDVKPGKNISTSYGSALVLEKGENGLIKIQPSRGNERWITSDSILVTYK